MADQDFPFTNASDERLERALRDLGARLAYPPTPDLDVGVRRRLAGEGPTRRLDAWAVLGSWLATGRRVVAIAAVALVLLVAAILALAPGLRTAVADRLGLPGVVIRLIDGEVEPSPVGARLLLGRRLSLEEAAATVAYPIQVPTLDGFARPDEVYLSSVPADQMVSLVYRARPSLPESRFTGVGALLTQFPGDTERVLIEKGLLEKGIGPGATLEAIAVDGDLGFWIEGEPHSFLYRDPSGEIRGEEFRLAGNVLLWQRDGLTFRLESELPQEEAIRIAESVRVVG